MHRVAIVGGSGFAGGELLRLLLGHPDVEVVQATSRSLAGRPLHQAHPNLRGRTDLRFSPPDDLLAADVRFVALGHGETAADLDRLADGAGALVDLSADFRLRDPGRYEATYGAPHPCPERLGEFVYGLPELHRDALAGATRVSGVGCNATAVNLALLPLARHGLIERAVVEVKVGSSEAGGRPSDASHHPVRAGAVRAYAPTGHRHQAEVAQELGDFPLSMSVTAIEMVRGAAATAHVFPTRSLDEKELWGLFREAFRDEPFVRIVKERRGAYRYPEPKILAGTNLADVGFARDEASDRVVVLSAIDNLGKGAAGSAVQSMNLMLGLDETRGLDFFGLCPI